MHSSLFEITRMSPCVSPTPLALDPPASECWDYRQHHPANHVVSIPESQDDSLGKFLGSLLPLTIHFLSTNLSHLFPSAAQAPRWQVTLTFYLSLHPSPGHCIQSTLKCSSLPKPLPPFILTPRCAGWFIHVSCFLFSLPVWSWTGVGAKAHTCSTAEQHPNLCPSPESHDGVYTAARMGL